jgi:WhiB family redox-sensing transcriptional regulator
MVAQPVWVLDDEIQLAAAIPEWHLDALCREYEQVAGWWFPTQGHRSELLAAQEICRRCLVQSECLAAALDTAVDSDWGCWGGTSREERRVLRRKGVTGDLVKKYGPNVDAGRELELDLASFGGLDDNEAAYVAAMLDDEDDDD